MLQKKIVAFDEDDVSYILSGSEDEINKYLVKIKQTQKFKEEMEKKYADIFSSQRLAKYKNFKAITISNLQFLQKAGPCQCHCGSASRLFQAQPSSRHAAMRLSALGATSANFKT